MINGVIEIVAAVLFAVVFLSADKGIIWLWIAGFYLVCGAANLVIYTIRNRRKLRAAQKQAEKTVKQAEQAARQTEPAEQTDEENGLTLQV